MQRADERRRRGGRASRPNGDRGTSTEGKRRLFMAGRVDGDVQQVRFAPSIRAPIRGPWSLALVVKAG